VSGYCSVSLSAAGKRQRHHVNALLHQLGGFAHAGLAANAARFLLAIVHAARLVGKPAPTSSVLASTWRTALQECGLLRLACAGGVPATAVILRAAVLSSGIRGAEQPR
jgi:hypothetical protein